MLCGGERRRSRSCATIAIRFLPERSADVHVSGRKSDGEGSGAAESISGRNHRLVKTSEWVRVRRARDPSGTRARPRRRLPSIAGAMRRRGKVGRWPVGASPCAEEGASAQKSKIRAEAGKGERWPLELSASERKTLSLHSPAFSVFGFSSFLVQISWQSQ